MIRSCGKTRRHRELVKDADAWVRSIVMQRQGPQCLKCGQIKTLQAAHIFSKGAHPSIRFDLENVIGLCVKCHLYWAHKDPVGFVDWLNEKFPGRVDRLKLAAHQNGKIDLKELICVLKAIHQQG